MTITSSNILICGAGILGLTVASELVKQGYESIHIIDKESQLGVHASGRNSGVLHAGIYYPAKTLKAQVCLKGNELMTKFCHDHQLPLLDCGKVIVAKNSSEISIVEQLYSQAKENGAVVELIDPKKLAEIEPWAKTTGIALWSKSTRVVDSKQIMKRLKKELEASGKVTFSFDEVFLSKESDTTVITSKGPRSFNYFINVAGAFSDVVAHQFNVATDYKAIPFKGCYQQLVPSKWSKVNGNIYPVPDLNFPFLGIHFTRNVKGEVYVGPTASPAFGREHYGVLTGISSEFLAIGYQNMMMLLFSPQFRKLAWREVSPFSESFFEEARSLVKELSPNDLIPSTKVGIRPQLIHWPTKKLEMDFVLESTAHSVHVVNAISPAWTSSMALAELIVERMQS